METVAITEIDERGEREHGAERNGVERTHFMKLMSIRFIQRLCLAVSLNLGWLASQPKRAAHRLEHRKSIVLT